ncbi:MAG: hypothetical protein UU58_C0002G0041 [Candidatus Nomurabacteria bacterium GW2011_GWA2_41_25]|uniref:Uncharacterized protein n=1 Tax=Candidatus Nomurabacteria bacterium GW2011_GWA2_41_25 TaxID=1618736 RepID=A0A0G0VW20_9BACT|nr:MAG: hypothetical protein UU58_C0002G0041 [Candidatus Nomurabacteria bacterium GW2011_GWA2_41_25]
MGEEKKLKDSASITDISVMDISFSISYTKTHKLITALYMVTDIIDKDEPIRGKLRTLGTEIISDMHSVPAEASNKIAETVSFLNIASAMNFISEMNCTILKKEFLELQGSIQEYTDMKPTWLAEFFTKENNPYPTSPLSRGKSGVYKGHTRIGVQKGSTLMKALSDKTQAMSNSKARLNMLGLALHTQRREEIKDSIKANDGNATIKDIKDKASGSLVNCGKKTLQRELVSMVRDGVLNKIGEKRWSRYSL